VIFKTANPVFFVKEGDAIDQARKAFWWFGGWIQGFVSIRRLPNFDRALGNRNVGNGPGALRLHERGDQRRWAETGFSSPGHEFNKRVVLVSKFARSLMTCSLIIASGASSSRWLGELKPRFRPPPLIASFMQSEGAGAVPHIPVPKGPVEVW